MAEQAKEKQGAFTIQMPKNGEDKNGFWCLELKDMNEATYVACASYLRKEKYLDAIRFLLRNLYVGGDNVEEVCADWRSVMASGESILTLMPQGQAQIKKLEEYNILAERTAEGLLIHDPSTPEGLEQILALIFYTGKDLDPTKDIDKVFRYWKMIEFGLHFEDKYSVKRIIRG